MGSGQKVCLPLLGYSLGVRVERVDEKEKVDDFIRITTTRKNEGMAQPAFTRLGYVCVIKDSSTTSNSSYRHRLPELLSMRSLVCEAGRRTATKF